MMSYLERGDFPFEVVIEYKFKKALLKGFNMGGLHLNGYGCPANSFMGAAAYIAEVFRTDASIGIYLLV